jgi:hypothetical protein
LIEGDQPDSGARKQQDEKADSMVRAAAPFADTDDPKTGLIHSEDPHAYLG